MSVVKVIELIAESDRGWEEATQEGIKEASKTIRNIKTAYVQDMQAIVENERITKYRVNLKVSFSVE